MSNADIAQAGRHFAPSCDDRLHLGVGTTPLAEDTDASARRATLTCPQHSVSLHDLEAEVDAVSADDEVAIDHSGRTKL
jgi:hypothetical protein